jgi:hypothetical protein
MLLGNHCNIKRNKERMKERKEENGRRKSRRTFIESKNTSRVLNLLRQFEMPNLQFSTNSTNHKLPLTMNIELLIGVYSTNLLQ